VLRFSLSFFGNYFEWNAGSELKFGHFLTDMSTEGVAYSASDPIQWEKDVPREMGEAAVKFVENIASLERMHRTYLIDQIRTAAKLF
jgi:hypothetical protein